MTPKVPFLVKMDCAIYPVDQTRNEHILFRRIAGAIGIEEAFTDGSTSNEWLRWLWSASRQRAAAEQIDLPE